MNNGYYHRIAGAFYLASTVVYLVWLLTHLNTDALLISIPFFFVQLFTFIILFFSIINHWSAKYRTQRPLLPDPAEKVAVIVPTYKEPAQIVQRTVKSMLHLRYPNEVIILLSNDDQSAGQKQRLTRVVRELAEYWTEEIDNDFKIQNPKKLFLRHSEPHGDAKAGNLNQCLNFLEEHFPEVDLVLTQDADEVCYPEMFQATAGYFERKDIAYVQTIKQAKTASEDPFGNQDFLWYCRTAPSREADNAMFANGSGVVWRVSAVRSIGGFSTWNLVEDLTTSYDLLARGWQGRYHYEALSHGISPEDLANFIKQRATWAMDTMRLFFWDNPIKKKGLSLRQKLQFLETQLFYLNSFVTISLVIITSMSLIFEVWPTTEDALTHAKFMLPSFIFLEAYLLLLGGKIPFRRVRQFWVGLSPYFALSTLKALVYGPDSKPRYRVTKKEDEYGNYLNLVIPQIILVGLTVVSMLKVIVSTPLYSAFDWAAVFWGFYQASFYVQIIKVSWFGWYPKFEFDIAIDRSLNLGSLRLPRATFDYLNSKLDEIVDNN